MRVSAKADYAVRAAIELVGATEDSPVPGERIAESQEIPLRFLEYILDEMRQERLVYGRHGEGGGYWLSAPAETISIADVMRAVEGPLATVRGERPEEIRYSGDAEPLQRVWAALRTNIRDVLENVTLADVVAGDLAAAVLALADRPDVSQSR
jgi:Rrf2 family protein